MPGYRKGSFTGPASSLTIDNATEAELAVTGTFTGSLTLQVSMADSTGADAWAPVGAALTAPGVITVKGGQARKWRVTATALSAGQADYELAGSRNKTIAAASGT